MVYQMVHIPLATSGRLMHTHIKKDNFTQESSAYAQVFFQCFWKTETEQFKKLKDWKKNQEFYGQTLRKKNRKKSVKTQ